MWRHGLRSFESCKAATDGDSGISIGHKGCRKRGGHCCIVVNNQHGDGRSHGVEDTRGP
ncbi:hypothetical protein AWB80_06200 [Caballeronia pedi]|uniref:Uncharacterized protein n=1 Tax=Caballeronia pedi TaxID=1777141 RepID=A0A158D3U3_9BURK|nr:hypothetical protein AWB80_06200 [Caballeronia pedi]